MTQQIFNEWLDEIIRNENPSEDILAYYFGIHQTTQGYETYLIGSKVFDEGDDDWACNIDFVPTNKYLRLGNGEAEWEQILIEVKQFVANYLETETFNNSFMEKAEAIAIGFDDGDLYRLK